MSAARTRSRYLVLPGATAWELWEFGSGGAIFGRTAASLSALNAPAGSVVCVPGGELCCYAVWLATEDNGLLEEMADLQLEARGLPVRGKTDAATALKRLKAQSGRTLCLTVCHPHAARSLKDVEYVGACTASFEGLDFEDNAVTLWRELGVLNAAVRAGGRVVAVQRMSGDVPGRSVATEIECLLAELQMEGVIESVQALHVWDSGDTPPGEEIQDRLKLPLICRSRPVPIWPGSGVDLLPARFRVEKRVREKRRQMAKAATALGAVAVVLIVLLALNVLWLSFEQSQLEKGNSPLRPQVGSVRDTSLRWHALSPALDADSSALEILYQVVRRLPPSDVRLTMFQIKNGDLLVEGESENVAHIAVFEGGISASPELRDYSWKMPPPTILANNTAHFQIGGSHR